MNIKIGNTLTTSDISELEHIETFNGSNIYLLQDFKIFLLAIDNNGLIISAFEFIDREDGIQLAHMYTMDNYKRQGFGKELMKHAVHIWEVFELPSTNNNDMYYFNKDGLPFTMRCFDHGILTVPPFTRPIN